MAADGFDPGVDLVPPGEQQTADEALAASLSGLAPDTQPDTPRPLGRGWAFDFEIGEFVEHGTSPARIDGLDQLELWIEKTMRTARFAHAVYSDRFGVDNPNEGVGFAFDAGTAQKIENQITDALTVHDRISKVQDFSFDTGGGSSLLTVGFRVVTDQQDEMTMTVPFGRV